MNQVSPNSRMDRDYGVDWTRIVRRFAHDLNSELQPVVSLSGLALEDLPPDSDTWGDIQLVHESANRAAELVTHMSNFAHQGAPLTLQAAILATLAEAASHWGEIARLSIRGTANPALGSDLLLVKDRLVAPLIELGRRCGCPSALAATIDGEGVILSIGFPEGTQVPEMINSTGGRGFQIDYERLTDTACRLQLAPG